MLIKASFEVPVRRPEAWKVLLDVERIAPCLPGATLEGSEGTDTYLGRAKIKIGPILAQYAGKVHITEADEQAGRLLLSANGKEQRGTGRAEAVVEATLTEKTAGVTQVDVETTVDITGKAAQFGRGVMEDVAKTLIAKFADNLAAQLHPSEPAPQATPASAAVGTRSTVDSSAPSLASVSGSSGQGADLDVLALLAASPKARWSMGTLALLAVLVIRWRKSK